MSAGLGKSTTYSEVKMAKKRRTKFEIQQEQETLIKKRRAEEHLEWTLQKSTKVKDMVRKFQDFCEFHLKVEEDSYVLNIMRVNEPSLSFDLSNGSRDDFESVYSELEYNYQEELKQQEKNEKKRRVLSKLTDEEKELLGL